MTRMLLAAVALTLVSAPLTAQPDRDAGDKSAEYKAAAKRAVKQAKKDRLAALAKKLSGCVFEGAFTTDGRKGAPRTERYEISKAAPVGDGPKWIIGAKIQYAARKAITVPVPVQILWAGNTPVITLTKTTIPGMGTFSARVVIHGDRYAGTWQHDDKGGHLFGKIVKAKKDEKPSK